MSKEKQQTVSRGVWGSGVDVECIKMGSLTLNHVSDQIKSQKYSAVLTRF